MIIKEVLVAKRQKSKGYECKWNTLFIIFQLPSTFKSVKKSVKLYPVQFFDSKQTVAIDSTTSIVLYSHDISVAGPLLSFQS